MADQPPLTLWSSCISSSSHYKHKHDAAITGSREKYPLDWESIRGNLGIGGAGGIRTPDLLDAIEARSQLRHGPTVPNVEKL